jgi:hypothetical protein
MARPRGFEPLTFAFGGQTSEPVVACPEASHTASQKESFSPALKRSVTHRTSPSFFVPRYPLLRRFNFLLSSNRGHRISKGRERD